MFLEFNVKLHRRNKCPYELINLEYFDKLDIDYPSFDSGGTHREASYSYDIIISTIFHYRVDLNRYVSGEDDMVDWVLVQSRKKKIEKLKDKICII